MLIFRGNQLIKMLFRNHFDISPDQVAILGKKDFLFLYLGYNRYYQMYFERSSEVLKATNDWSIQLNTWQQFTELKSNSFHFICVPNKASLHSKLYPLFLGASKTPYLLKLEKTTNVQVFAPRDIQLVFRRNDTHLSPKGNFEFANFILESLGYTYDFGELRSTGFQEIVGDLGSKFDPPIHEKVEFFASSKFLTLPQVVVDNSSEYLPERHIGITIQLSNSDAPFKKSLRIFGNSFLGNASEYSTLWLLGVVFQKVTFHWSPVVLPEVIENEEIVIFQTCERFLGYSPEYWK
jgi:hypothetical protein